jgi:peptide/nickel transport system ATP-binding protein
MALLELRDLKIDFRSRRGNVQAVRGIDLSVEKSEIVGVVGESGAGKSTIGNAILGLIEPPGRISGGEILFQGERIDTLAPAEMEALRGRRIGMIFQDPMTALNPLFTVGEQLIETISQHLGLSHAQARKRAIELLREVEIPDPETRIDQYPHQFSGGMRQRVVITLALCADPDLVIADEPTTALDVSVQSQILGLLRKLCKERGVGVIIITHDMGVVSEITERVAVMHKGLIVEVGPTAQVLGRPRNGYTRSLMAAVPRPDIKLERFPILQKGGEDARAPIDVRNSWLGQAVRQRPAATGPLVEVKNLTMQFVAQNSIVPAWRRVFTAVNDVSFAIADGETLGLVGESGSGKSTVARMIAGLYRPSNGHVLFEGTDITGIDAGTGPQRQQIQMIFQDPFSSLNRRMRVRDIIAEPIRHHRLADGDAEISRIVAELLDHVELGAGVGHRYPHEFSGGQRQRISIARALASRPRFLICDEPTSSLDVSIQAQLLNLLMDLQQQLGLTMLFISHDLAVVRQLCDRVGVMHQGRLVELAETETLFERPQNAYTAHLLKLMPKVVTFQPELEPA